VYRSSPRVVHRSSPTVVYDSPSVVYDSPDVLYRSPKDIAYWNGVWTGRLEAAAITVSAAVAYHKVKEMMDEDEGDESGEGAIEFWVEHAETRNLMRELQAEITEADPLAVVIDKPIDGRYSGESAEDDAGDQDVSTTLSFGRDGSIVGEGFDSADGAYTIREGRWSQKRVAWIEEYDEGFTVALRGQVRPDGTIVALWASSRNVGGSVSLMAPAK